MAKYQASLERFDVLAGQVLLTAQDLELEETSTNAQLAINRLLELKALPIVNENDTVATAEIRFGDNDRLAALVAILVDADALILLSDVDALYDRPPTEEGAQKIEWVEPRDDLSSIKLGGSTSAVGTGGAETKLGAARTATDAGITVILTSIGNAKEVLSGGRVGTWFQGMEDN
jgi:glutamate 5-kinase